ncbi:hypothetical protein ES703_99788 [subsurface metagenome]
MLYDKESVSHGMHDHLTGRINTLLIHDLHGALGMCCPAYSRFIDDFPHFARSGRLQAPLGQLKSYNWIEIGEKRIEVKQRLRIDTEVFESEPYQEGEKIGIGGSAEGDLLVKLS